MPINPRNSHKSTQFKSPQARTHTGHVKQIQNNPDYDPTDDIDIDYRMQHSMALNNINAINRNGSNPPLSVNITVDEVPIQMEIDTGAAVSLVSHATYAQHWESKPLPKSTARLKTYSGEDINVLGEIEVSVMYENQCENLPLVVVAGVGPSLLGRDWLQLIRLDWRAVNHIKVEQQSPLLKSVLQKHCKVFEGGLGTLENFKAKIYVDPNATPV